MTKKYQETNISYKDIYLSQDSFLINSNNQKKIYVTEKEFEIIKIFFKNKVKNCNRTANITTDPPIKTIKGGFSLTNIHAQRGPKTASVSIIIPTNAEGVDLAPTVIKINPNPN